MFKLKNQEKGFTIIEVLIVLAIAGLIMLVVFLAVPSLQRNSRNSQRKSDVSNMLAAVSEFSTNNNGRLPSTFATATSSLTGATGTTPSEVNLGFYDPATDVSVGPATLAVDTAAESADSRLQVRTGMKCNGAVLTATGATSRSVAVLYYIETSGSPAPQCQES